MNLYFDALMTVVYILIVAKYILNNCFLKFSVVFSRLLSSSHKTFSSISQTLIKKNGPQFGTMCFDSPTIKHFKVQTLDPFLIDNHTHTKKTHYCHRINTLRSVGHGLMKPSLHALAAAASDSSPNSASVKLST